jgi:uncharacterized protein (TIGR04255 family)
MTIWPNAPLVYTLGIVRFPQIPNVERFVDGFHDAVRDRYPLRSQIASQNLTAVLGPDGLKVDRVEEPLWQFTDVGCSHAYILGSQFLVIHAGRGYQGHQDFAGRLREGLARLIAVREIGIIYALVVGFRYINLVTPRMERNEELSTYLRDWALPTEMPKIKGIRLDLHEAVYVTAFQTDLGGLRFQALRRPPSTLPPDLTTPFVSGNNWILPRPEEDFAVLDIDHGVQFAGEQPLDPDVMADRIVQLRKVPSVLLLEAATPFALKVWRDEE